MGTNETKAFSKNTEESNATKMSREGPPPDCGNARFWRDLSPRPSGKDQDTVDIYVVVWSGNDTCSCRLPANPSDRLPANFAQEAAYRDAARIAAAAQDARLSIESFDHTHCTAIIGGKGSKSAKKRIPIASTSTTGLTFSRFAALDEFFAKSYPALYGARQAYGLKTRRYSRGRLGSDGASCAEEPCRRTPIEGGGSGERLCEDFKPQDHDRQKAQEVAGHRSDDRQVPCRASRRPHWNKEFEMMCAENNRSRKRFDLFVVSPNGLGFRIRPCWCMHPSRSVAS